MSTIIHRPSLIALDTSKWVHANAPPSKLTEILAEEWNECSGSLLSEPVFEDTSAEALLLLGKQPGLIRRLLLWQWAATKLRESVFTLSDEPHTLP